MPSHLFLPYYLKIFFFNQQFLMFSGNLTGTFHEATFNIFSSILKIIFLCFFKCHHYVHHFWLCPYKVKSSLKSRNHSKKISLFFEWLHRWKNKCNGAKSQIKYLQGIYNSYNNTPGFTISMLVMVVARGGRRGEWEHYPHIDVSTWYRRWGEQLAISEGSSLYQLMSTYQHL